MCCIATGSSSLLLVNRLVNELRERTLFGNYQVRYQHVDMERALSCALDCRGLSCRRDAGMSLLAPDCRARIALPSCSPHGSALLGPRDHLKAAARFGATAVCAARLV